MTIMHAYDPNDPPLWLAANVLSSVLRQQPRRLAFAGPAGAGKTTLCHIIGGYDVALRATPEWILHPQIPIFNHADSLKEEVLEWLAIAYVRRLIPDSNAALDSFCEFLGLSPELVKRDMWDLVGPVWAAMSDALTDVYERRLAQIADFATIPHGQDLRLKLAFVETHKQILRSALQKYGEVIKEITASPTYWADQTVTRALDYPLCLNGDTRYPEEIEVLRGTGWTTIYLSVSPDIQLARRPGMTRAQLEHSSETSIGPEHCDYVLDSNQSLGKVVMDLAEQLSVLVAVAC